MFSFIASGAGGGDSLQEPLTEAAQDTVLESPFRLGTTGSWTALCWTTTFEARKILGKLACWNAGTNGSRCLVNGNASMRVIL